MISFINKYYQVGFAILLWMFLLHSTFEQWKNNDFHIHIATQNVKHTYSPAPAQTISQSYEISVKNLNWKQKIAFTDGFFGYDSLLVILIFPYIIWKIYLANSTSITSIHSESLFETVNFKTLLLAHYFSNRFKIHYLNKYLNDSPFHGYELDDAYYNLNFCIIMIALLYQINDFYVQKINKKGYELQKEQDLTI